MFATKADFPSNWFGRTLLLLTILLPWNSVLSLEFPLPIEGHSDFYQRILSLPDAKLLDEPNGEIIQDAVAVFTIYYVFERRTRGIEEWLRVGQRPDHSEGWISGNHAEDWKNMLVLQFAPPGQRERVLFFRKTRELKRLLKQSGAKRAALLREYYDLIEDERAPRGVFAAIEPPFGIAQGRGTGRREGNNSDYRYLLPILDWRSEARFRHGARPGEPGPDTTLVQLAMVNTKDHEMVDPDSAEGKERMAASGGMLNPALRDAKVGVVFVIDATTSMGPYIEQVRRLVRQVYERIADSPYHNHIRYGLVAYRDNLSHNAKLEYVTRIFQPLDPDTPPDRLLENLRRVKASTVPTRGWEEDAFAAVDVAIGRDWWAPFRARFIILVTDAGARLPARTDPLASTSANASTLRTRAGEKGIAIIPMHLKTEQARKAGDVLSAADQYWVLGDTGDRNVNKYRGIEANTPALFTKSLDDFTDKTLDVLDQWSRGAAIERPEEAESDQGIIANELFRAQMEYLGEREGQEIPRFYRGWATDRDLLDPDNKSFSIDLLLTRNQLSALAKAVNRLLDKMYEADLAPEDFLGQIQSLSATLSVDPDREDSAPRTLGDTLPAWLEQLPYRSDILMLTAEDWLQQGAQQRNLYIDQLAAKLETYRALEADSDRWLRRRQAEELGLLGLEDLP
uniref:Serine/threonine-protein kinase PpkA n=1 Tax=Candidatus Kentrum sp. LPFa TaxID=2126335 RepID=A0A450W734_9GAMM|nr:MAG: serine/threonine-protein kinase PpkA [Candidatus Kentron sp. LPFa]